MKRYYVIALTAALSIAGSVLYAQTADPLSTEVKGAYTGIKNNVTKAAEKMSEENYAFKATPDVQSFGQRVAHIADSNMRTCAAIKGEQKTVGAAAKTSKADLVAALKESFGYCDAIYDSLTDAEAAKVITTPRGQRSKLATLWGIVVQPVAFFVFVTAALAETKRIPFDMPEGESEVIGYFVEYSGMKFGMFFLADFLETIMVACLATTLFLGGWQIPYLMRGGFHFPWGATLPIAPLAYVLLGVASFSIKVLVFCWLFMQIRWTLPRFRYDQLMTLGWKAGSVRKLKSSTMTVAPRSASAVI